jgi:peptide/nickel transport system permease protein
MKLFGKKRGRISPGLAVGATLLLLVLGLAMISPFLARQDGGAGSALQSQLCTPGKGHILGCDEDGRDLFERIAGGARVALLVGVLTVLVSSTVGTFLGAFSGYLGGWPDELLMRLVDILMSFPGVLLAIGITAATPSHSIWTVVIALSATGWVSYARLARAQALSLRGRDYVLAARVMGAGGVRIVAVHLIPNMFAPLVVQMTFGMASAILAEASLSFLGLGPQGSGSWGALLDQGTQYISIRYHLALFPGLALSATVLGLNLLGDGLRDMVDPKSPGRL